MDENAEWRALAGDILQTAHDIFRTAVVRKTEKEKYLGQTLLARTISNFRGALLLLDNRRVIEARIITRCCLENSFWVAGLVEEGRNFVRAMANDTVTHKQRAGQRLIEPGVPLGDEAEQTLRTWLKWNKNEFKNSKQLSPNEVAEKSTNGRRAYLFYQQLSSDSCHPSLDALHRHVVLHSGEQVGGVDVEPIPTKQEVGETFEYLCMAVMEVCICVNELLG